jgi:hypothetical protein
LGVQGHGQQAGLTKAAATCRTPNRVAHFVIW